VFLVFREVVAFHRIDLIRLTSLLGGWTRLKEALNDKEDRLNSIVSEYFNQTGNQIEAGISNVSLLVNILVSVVNEMIVISLVIALSVIGKDHVASDSL
jgi:hypothetical protein